ncbi:glycosyltransferase [Flammeovirgaceae bacterium SG7u.111]|nr:glycosyltransferase [Flammeovirgaceae bacterium SG7u.132]WPO34559.1 glycosyltransferase [Flammeovirgaceae bacterium SG7u.111]
MKNNLIKISVIIPTYNRSQLLEQCLKALAGQTLDPLFFEVIVVNDGSTDNTKEIIDLFCYSLPNLIYLEQQNQGPAVARNLGASIAKSNYLAFTDDDCQADSDWLEKSLLLFTNELVGIQGKTYTNRVETSPLTHQIDNEKGSYAVPTCNAIYYKPAFWEVGGFDESFPFPHNEDADLAWRISQLGTIRFCPEVCVYHPPRLEHFSKLKKRMKIMESEFLLFYKNPVLYKKYRNASPWHTIYREVFFKHLPIKFLSSLKKISTPVFMFQNFGLILYWWYDLVRLFPRFWSLRSK